MCFTPADAESETFAPAAFRYLVALGKVFRFVGSRLEHDARHPEVGDSKEAHEGAA